jgi:hypothetical protein
LNILFEKFYTKILNTFELQVIWMLIEKSGQVFGQI